MVLTGILESGHGDAGRWLSKFNDAYVRQTGIPIFPGSLNLRLLEPFDWFSTGLPSPLVEFRKREYGGERDILMLPCVLPLLDRTRGYLWTTVNAANEADTVDLVEVIASIGLRDAFGLEDGDVIELELV